MINILWLLEQPFHEKTRKIIEDRLQCKIQISYSFHIHKHYDIIVFNHYSFLKHFVFYQKRNLIFFVYNDEKNILNKQSIYIDYYIMEKNLYTDLCKAIFESKNLLLNMMNTLYLKNGHIYYHIKKDNIIYIESYKNNIIIHTAYTQYTLRYTLKKIREILGVKFIQCHKSFIINIYYIKSIRNNFVVLNNEDQVPIGYKYKESLKEINII